jgi:hypothetical protein
MSPDAVGARWVKTFVALGLRSGREWKLWMFVRAGFALWGFSVSAAGCTTLNVELEPAPASLWPETFTRTVSPSRNG